MLDKERKLLEGLVEVWGNDYKKNKGRVALDKYLLNFNKLDRLHEEEYLNNINSIRNKTDDLFKEHNRLNKLNEYILKRLKDREYLVNNYLNVTGGEYPNYTSIALENEFDNIKSRYNIISKYLDNINKLDNLREKNSSNNKKLLELKEELIGLESKNSLYEEELKKYFDDNFIVNVSNHIDYEDRSKLSLIYDERTTKIEEFLDDNIDAIKEEELTKIRFENFNIKCQLMLFDINRLLVNKCLKYNDMFNKRMDILKLIDKRESLIKKYDFKVYSDDYLELVNLINNQIELLKPQIEHLNKIDIITKDIDNNIKEIESIDEDNNSHDILEIKKEYNLINNDIKIDKEPNYNIEDKINDIYLDKLNTNNIDRISMEEDILKEEENLAKILKELDIKVDKIPALDRVKASSNEDTSLDKEDNKTNNKEEIPDLNEVIKALEKEYSTNIDDNDNKEDNNNIKEDIPLENKEDIKNIDDNNNFTKAMDEINLDMTKEEDDMEFDKIGGLNFLNGEELDNILTNKED